MWHEKKERCFNHNWKIKAHSFKLHQNIQISTFKMTYSDHIVLNSLIAEYQFHQTNKQTKILKDDRDANN